MSLKIAETTFITKADSGLAAVDIYGDIDKEAKSPGGQTSGLGGGIRTPNIAGEINKITEDLTKALQGTGSFEDTIGRVNDILKNKDKLVDNLKDAVSNDLLTHIGLGAQAGTITDILAGRKDPSDLLGVVAATNPQMKIVVSGVEKILDAKDIGTANGIASLLGELTGNTELAKVFDLAPEFLIYSTLLDDMTKLRIPELIDLVFDEVDESQKSKLMTASIPRVAKRSDLLTLEKISDYVGRYALQSTHPDIIKDLLANYKTVSGELPTAEEITHLKGVLDNIDETWWSYNRDGKEIPDLGVLSNLSEHAHFALSKMEGIKEVRALFNLYETLPLPTLLETYKPWVTMA